jgi:Neuraminidase (sialidase)
VRKSVDGGASFLPETCAHTGVGGATPSKSWTVVDPSNSSKVYIAYPEDVSTSGGSTHIFVVRSTDAGATWSAPVRVDESLPDDVVDHLAPSISVSSTGRVDVVWFDYRNASPKHGSHDALPGDVYYSYSTNGGVIWATSIRLSTSTATALAGGGNDFLTVTSSASKAYAVYSQDTDGNNSWEALLATVTFH